MKQDTNTEILEAFEKLMRLEGLSKTTIKNYKHHIQEYFKTYSLDLTRNKVAEYLSEKKDSG